MRYQIPRTIKSFPDRVQAVCPLDLGLLHVRGSGSTSEDRAPSPMSLCASPLPLTGGSPRCPQLAGRRQSLPVDSTALDRSKRRRHSIDCCQCFHTRSDGTWRLTFLRSTLHRDRRVNSQWDIGAHPLTLALQWHRAALRDESSDCRQSERVNPMTVHGRTRSDGEPAEWVAISQSASGRSRPFSRSK